MQITVTTQTHVNPWLSKQLGLAARRSWVPADNERTVQQVAATIAYELSEQFDHWARYSDAATATLAVSRGSTTATVRLFLSYSSPVAYEQAVRVQRPKMTPVR